MTEYTLKAGDSVNIKAEFDCRVRVEDFGGIITIEACELAGSKRKEAARLLKEADMIDASRKQETL